MTQEHREKEEYEKKAAQAVSQIPVYSKEWTNHLPSDPGMTILENLTAFYLLLLEKQKEIPDEVRVLLPGLAGMTPHVGSGARVLLGAAGAGGPDTIPPYQRFYLGNTCFETICRLKLSPGKLKKVYFGHREKASEVRELEELRPGNPLAAPVFGSQPQKGDTVYLVFDGPFAEASGEVILYVSAQEKYPRSSPDPHFPASFADAVWSYYTEEGYEAADCQDCTDVFLKSGEIRIRMGHKPPSAGRVGDEEGYIIRCELLCVSYDQIPCVRSIDGPLFEVYERESRAVSYEISCKEKEDLLEEILASGFSPEDTCFFMYTGNDAEGFREEGAGRGQDDSHQALDSSVSVQKKDREQMRLLRMDKEMAVQKDLGILYGYDSQELELDMQGEIIVHSLEIMVEKGQGDTRRFHFFKPEDQRDQAVHYEYDPGRKVIRILDAGDFEGCRVSIAGCAVFHGSTGNVLAGNTFLRPGGQKGEVYYNPHAGRGGEGPEGPAGFAGRLRDEALRSKALVTEADYEQAVLCTPDLCIHKVHAFRGGKSGEIEICVKPYGEEELPGLSKLYKRQIRAWLEQGRLLGDRQVITGPEYVRVDVFVSAAVKLEYAGAEKEIEQTVIAELDHVNGEQDFGGCISRYELIKALEKLPCVEYIRELKLIPQKECGPQPAEGNGMEIRLKQNVLCCVGKVEVLVKRSHII